MKLYRLKWVPWGGTGVGVAGVPLYLTVGKLYSAEVLSGLSDERLSKWFEPAGDLPSDKSPATVREALGFCNRWIRFLLEDPRVQDLDGLAGILRPVVRTLRDAVEAMPDAPPPPSARRLSYSDVTAVATELKRWRTWARDALPPKGTEPPSSLPPEGTVYAEEKDVPKAFRDGGKPGGPVLTVSYLANNSEWDLKGSYLSKRYGPDGELTTRIRVGKKAYAYLFKEVAALRTVKTANEDARER